MIRTMRGRESGMSFWPFVGALLLLFVVGYLWYEADQKASSLELRLATLEPRHKAAEERFAELNRELLELGKVTGYTDAGGKPDKEQIKAGTQRFLANVGQSFKVSIPTRRYELLGDAGGPIEARDAETVTVNFMPPTAELPHEPTMESALPIVVSAAAQQTSAYQSMVERAATEVQAKATLQQQHEQAIATLNTQVADLRTEAQSRTAERQEMERNLKEQIDQLRVQVEQATSETQELRAQSETQVARLEARLAEKTGEVVSLTAREVPFAAEGPDGEVLASGAGVVVVNRGKADMLMPGTVFTVLGRQKGGTLFPKATIKVTTVDDQTARARVVEQVPGHPIVQGDLVQSATYSPKRQLRFALVGDFTKMGRSVAEARLRSLGAQIDHEVTPETHYLVVGGATESVEETPEYRRAKEYGIQTLSEAQLEHFTRY
jgi:hypothetical protein